jgi:uncharacterized protein (DUF1330 family)
MCGESLVRVRLSTMAKAYWVVCYRSISDDTADEKYIKIAVPAVLAAGGRFLARGVAAKAYEHGLKERTVVVEFESLDKANRCRRWSGVPSGTRRSGEWG